MAVADGVCERAADCVGTRRQGDLRELPVGNGLGRDDRGGRRIGYVIIPAPGVPESEAHRGADLAASARGGEGSRANAQINHCIRATGGGTIGRSTPL